MTEAWPKGSMEFVFKDPPGYIGHRYVSKKGEPPSKFIARVIKDRRKDCAVIWPYLQAEMKDTDETGATTPPLPCAKCGTKVSEGEGDD